MQALSNKYGMPIKIISISNFNDSNPKVERMEPDGDFIVKQKVEETILLNTGRVDFELIRKKEKSTKVSAPAPQDCPPAKVPSPGSLESPAKLQFMHRILIYFQGYLHTFRDLGILSYF